jgi:hypothetical protein
MASGRRREERLPLQVVVQAFNARMDRTPAFSSVWTRQQLPDAMKDIITLKLELEGMTAK